MSSISKRLSPLVLAFAWPLACGHAEPSEPQLGSGGRAMGVGGTRGGVASLGGEGGVMTASGGDNAEAGVFGTSFGGSGFGGSGFGGATNSTPKGSGGSKSSGGGTNVETGGTSPDPSAGVPNVPEPELCARLGNSFPTPAGQVAWAYTTALLADCRLSGFYNSLSIPERASAVNGVNTFSQELWGCLENEVSGFALAMGASKLSRADSELLISDYLDAATIYADLSRRERMQLATTLESLAASAITLQSNEYTHSECVSTGGAGGAGGAGGESGSGGHAGTGGGE